MTAAAIEEMKASNKTLVVDFHHFNAVKVRLQGAGDAEGVHDRHDQQFTNHSAIQFVRFIHCNPSRFHPTQTEN